MPDRQTIGVLTPLVAGPYFGAVLAGIARQTAASGTRGVVIQTLDLALGDAHPGVPEFGWDVAWQQVQGFVVVTGAVPDAYLTRLHDAGKAIVLLSHEVPGLPLPAVSPDNRSGVRDAVAHLYATGHRRIAFAGHLAQADFLERYEGYREALAEHGLEATEDLFFETGDSMQSGGERAARRMLESGLTSTAVLAGNDLNAIGIMAALRAAGCRIPQDQAVIGFDDTPAAEHHKPALTSVSQNFGRLGAQAADLLMRSIAGEAVPQRNHLVPTSLVIRQSCGCLQDVARTVAPGSPRAPVVETHRTPRERLATRLRDEVLPATPGDEQDAEVSAACADLAAVVDAVARGAVPPPEQLGTAVATIYRAHPRAETAAALLAAVQDAVREMPGTTPDPATRARVDGCVRAIAVVIGEIRASHEARATTHLQVALRNEYEISMELLRGHEDDPASLRWLSRTTAPAGCLGLWSADAAADHGLDIVSTFGPRLEASVVGVTPVDRFPPAQVIAVADQHPGNLTFVLPVKTEERDWGLLAVVGPPEERTATGRETYFQWAAMLSVALDYGAMVESLRTQRKDLAQAYGRERELVESIRSSEERYALAARAANDGLWDWDLRSGSVYFSSRWKTMLGYEEDGIGVAPDEWLGRVHPEDVSAVRATVDACRLGTADSLENEHRIRAHDGTYRWVLCKALAVPGQGQPATRLVGSTTDITERRALEEQLRHQALYDTLTDLPSRALFLDRLTEAITRTSRHDGSQYAVLFFDLDGFKVVNDTFGHMTGDLLLRQMADRVRSGLRASDTAARLGGDEFTVLLEGLTDLSVVPLIVRQVQERVSAPCELDGSTLVVTATVGVTTSAIGYTRAEDALRDADIAMYRGKAQERGSYVVFDESMRVGVEPAVR